jgi:hypothetical protein
VGGAERLRHLDPDVDGIAERESVRRVERLTEREALEVLHHDVARAVRQGAEVEHLDDVARADGRGRTRLRHEAADGLLVLSQILPDDLERDSLV